jgi:hypothetical protein
MDKATAELVEIIVKPLADTSSIIDKDVIVGNITTSMNLLTNDEIRRIDRVFYIPDKVINFVLSPET